MSKQQSIKNYIISQRLTYLTFGAIIGYFIAQNQRPYDIILISVFTILGLILSEVYKRLR